nr:ankyrin repeat-containing domain, PGG domain protein [Tanacetum cinerariifolium]
MAGTLNRHDSSEIVHDLEYLYASILNLSNFVSVKLSSDRNYHLWKTQMLCLMKCHNMAGFVDDAYVSPRASSKEIMDQYDSLLKGWIFGSTSENVLGAIVDLASAKDVWEQLKSFYDVFVSHQQAKSAGETEAEAKVEEETKDVDVISAQTSTNGRDAVAIDVVSTKTVTEGDNKAAGKDKTETKKNLREATMKGDWTGADSILKEDNDLVREAISSDGSTILHIAVGIGNNDFVKNLCSYISNEDVVATRNSDGSTALHIAAIVGNKYAADLLLKKNKNCLQIRDKNGQEPLHKAYENMHLDTIGYLLKAVDEYGESMSHSFSTDASVHSHLHPGVEIGVDLLVNAISAKQYNLASELIEKFPKSASKNDHVLMAIAKTFPSGDYGETYIPLSWKNLWERLCSIAKQGAIITGRQNCFYCVTYGSPKAILSTDKNGYDIIQLAVIHRSERIYNLIYDIGERITLYRTVMDSSKNNILHLAGRLAPSGKLNKITGAALQLQRELQWREETPGIVFTREHEKLVKDGEMWMKTTAESSSITAALITTIVFAAAITVPGGSNQDKGMPVFTKEVAFIIFAVSDTISFFSATTALLVFLSILTARFSEKDFLVSLPRRLLIGICTLLLSAISMIVAFSATVFLVFCHQKPWMLLPICGFSLIPISFLVALQLPLIVDLSRSTYLRNFGPRKRDHIVAPTCATRSQQENREASSSNDHIVAPACATRSQQENREARSSNDSCCMSSAKRSQHNAFGGAENITRAMPSAMPETMPSAKPRLCLWKNQMLCLRQTLRLCLRKSRRLCIYKKQAKTSTNPKAKMSAKPKAKTQAVRVHQKNWESKNIEKEERIGSPSIDNEENAKKDVQENDDDTTQSKEEFLAKLEAMKKATEEEASKQAHEQAKNKEDKKATQAKDEKQKNYQESIKIQTMPFLNTSTRSKTRQANKGDNKLVADSLLDIQKEAKRKKKHDELKNKKELEAVMKVKEETKKPTRTIKRMLEDVEYEEPRKKKSNIKKMKCTTKTKKGRQEKVTMEESDSEDLNKETEGENNKDEIHVAIQRKRTRKIEEENMESNEKDEGSNNENEVLSVAKGKKRETMKKKTKDYNPKEKKLRNNASEDEDDTESKSEEELKKLRIVKIERAEKDKKTTKKVTYPTCIAQSSPKSLFEAINCLIEERKRYLKQIGFERYINIPIVELPATLAYHVIKNFHTPSMELRLQKGSIKATRQKVHDILGIPMGNRKLEVLEQKDANDPFITEWEEQYSHIQKPTPPAIALQMLGRHEADFMFKMNFITLFGSTMGTLENGGKVPTKLLKCIKEEVDITEIDWCDYILDSLRTNRVTKFEDDQMMFDFYEQYKAMFNDAEFNLYESSKDEDSDNDSDQDNDNNKDDEEEPNNYKAMFSDAEFNLYESSKDEDSNNDNDQDNNNNKDDEEEPMADGKNQNENKRQSGIQKEKENIKDMGKGIEEGGSEANDNEEKDEDDVNIENKFKKVNKNMMRKQSQ